MADLDFSQDFTFLNFHTCKITLGELFTGFLKYFKDFNAKKFGLTITKMLPRMDSELFFARESYGRNQCIIVKDPFSQTNAASSICSQKHLLNAMKVFKESADAFESR